MYLLERVDGSNIEAYQPLIPEILQRWAVEEKNWMFYGIAVDGSAVGVIALSSAGDVAHIRYVYLTPESRRMGYMERSISEVMFDLHDEGYSGLEMSYIPSEYPVIHDIALKYDFRIQQTDRAYFRFRASDVRNCKASSFAPQDIMRLKVLPAQHRSTLMKMIRDSGYDISSMGGIDNPSQISSSLTEYSLVYMENGRPKGALLVQDTAGSKLPDGAAAFGKIYPEPSAANLMLIYVGTIQTKAPLYLLSGLCRNVIKDFPENALLTGYFTLGHITNLFEGALGVKGNREVSAVVGFDHLDRYYIDDVNTDSDTDE
ncbi:hypothetical protein SAMN02910292_02177 [Lachnospiraceae bacterium XBB2008]|nr:hypothetical protein SAMN02910292_02177 [Lachnospiraceae bacterium XBB2008]